MHETPSQSPLLQPAHRDVEAFPCTIPQAHLFVIFELCIQEVVVLIDLQDNSLALLELGGSFKITCTAAHMYVHATCPLSSLNGSSSQDTCSNEPSLQLCLCRSASANAHKPQFQPGVIGVHLRTSCSWLVASLRWRDSALVLCCPA